MPQTTPRNRIRHPFRHASFAIAIALAMASQATLGAGFAIIEQSVSGFGNAFAGAAASAEDASTIFFNPAGLTRVDRQLVLAGHVVVPRAKFTDQGSTIVTGAALTGGNGGDAGVTALVPNFFYAHPLANGIRLGLGIHAPFGLATEYAPDWVGRYHAVKSELRTVNINPTVALRLNETISLGFGLSAQYIEAELSNRIDFGTIGALSGVPGLSPQNNDGSVTLKGDDWGYGFNLGILFTPSEATRVGIAYRSRIRHTLKGRADFENAPATLVAATGRFVDTGVRSSVKLPDMVSASIAHRIGTRALLLADATWTRWSTLQELRFRFDNPNEADGVTTLDWKNSWRYSVGLSYRWSERWTLRTGIAYDQTPIPNAQRRTPRIPGEDRRWVAVGASYHPSRNLRLDVGYAHLFIKDPRIAKTATGEDTFRGALNGTYDASVDILSAQLVWTLP